MKLAILHYHLNRGGVTRVVENQLAALDSALDPAEPWRAVVIYGGRRNDWNEALPGRLEATRLTLCEAPLLDYDDVRAEDGGRAAGGPDALAGQLLRVLGQQGLGPEETVVQVHNHALGKNRALPAVVGRLAEAGYALLLEIHDFAEDFRPLNYRRLGPLVDGRLYPQSPAVHYAVLNGRDHGVLQSAGVPRERLHLLPNPVPTLGPLPSRDAARGALRTKFGVEPAGRFLLYPVRCIRRKNVGEALLLSALAPAGTVLGLTLPPLNPLEAPRYEAWKQAAAALGLPCRFEVGAPGGLRFSENLAAADVILTTSVAEGFGMVYLESWLAERPLIGRDLPEITRDFVEAGLVYDWLWPALRVPVEWVGADRFHRTLAEAYGQVLAAYGRHGPPDLDDQLWAKVDGGRVDFGDLDEAMQRSVIEAVSRDPRNRDRLLLENPILREALELRPDEASGLVGRNRQTTWAEFSRVPSGRRLRDLLERVVDSPRGQAVRPVDHPEHILDRFLSPRRFRLLRS